MFLAQIVFSFRSPCLKTVVTGYARRGARSVGTGVCWLGVAGRGGMDRICAHAIFSSL